MRDYSNQAHPYRLQPSLHVVKYLDDSNEFAKVDDSYKLSHFDNQPFHCCHIPIDDFDPRFQYHLELS